MKDCILSICFSTENVPTVEKAKRQKSACDCVSICPFVSGSLFAPISRQEAALIQQQAPPSYGQLIAQGIIPPVEDFPTENPNEVREKLFTAL